MFNIFSKSKKPEQHSLSWLKADMHSHLLPGIDDGSPDIETSVELIRGFADLGYEKIITTPHVLGEMYPNTPVTINRALDQVRTALQKENINIDIHAAAEYFIDENFVRLLETKEKLLTLSGNRVLVEVSMVTAPYDFKEVLFEMQMQNYQPVLAHPERYIYLKSNKALFEELRDTGCMFQCNLLSLIGHYGTAVQELAGYLAKNNFYEYLGTDLHNEKHLGLLGKVNASSVYQKLRESGNIKNHLL